jgi:hypothetical protein
VSNENNAVVIVRDATGKFVRRIESRVYANTNNIITVDATSLASGIYHVEVKIADNESTFIKIRKD